MWQVWLVISGIFFVLEIATVGFFVFWFGIGAIFAMIVSLFTSNIIIQTTVFLITSTLLILLTKPFVQKISHQDTVQTNAYSIIGQTGVVTKEIDAKKGIGQIKVGSEIWTANTKQDEVIPVGTEVEILEISGVKAIVKPILVSITK